MECIKRRVIGDETHVVRPDENNETKLERFEFGSIIGVGWNFLDIFFLFSNN